MRYTAEELAAPLDTIGDRAWYAWLSLPRGPDGEPPSFRSLEEEGGLPEGVISKVVRGARRSLSIETADRMAKVLHVPFEWLLVADKAAAWRPRLTGPYRPRTQHNADKRLERVATLLRRMGFSEEARERAIRELASSAPTSPADPRIKTGLGTLSAEDVGKVYRLFLDAFDRDYPASALTWDFERMSSRVNYLLVSLSKGQAELESEHGLPKGILRALATGRRRNLGSPLLEKVAAALGASPEWLRTGAGAPPQPPERIIQASPPASPREYMRQRLYDLGWDEKRVQHTIERLFNEQLWRVAAATAEPQRTTVA